MMSGRKTDRKCRYCPYTLGMVKTLICPCSRCSSYGRIFRFKEYQQWLRQRNRMPEIVKGGKTIREQHNPPDR